MYQTHFDGVLRTASGGSECRMANVNEGTSTAAISIRDYPGLYQGADVAAAKAQVAYFRLQRLYLGCLIVGGVAGQVASLATGDWRKSMHTVVALALCIGLIALWVGRARRDDQAWFDCRAIAESVKTATWRFMMVVPPFGSVGAIEERFVAELHEIREARPEGMKRLSAVVTAGSPAISDFMRAIRAAEFDVRKALYLEWRLGEQKSWYARKAELNARDGTRWFWVAVLCQGAALVLAVLLAVGARGVIDVVPVLLTLLAVAAAWSQIKRHDELEKTYALASQELSELDTIAMDLRSEGDFPQLVEQVEEAISREHTMWCARRDVRLRQSSCGARPRNVA